MLVQASHQRKRLWCGLGHCTLNTQHSTLNTQLSTLNAQHSTLNTQHPTLHTPHFTLNTQHSRGSGHGSGGEQETSRLLLSAQVDARNPQPKTPNLNPQTLHINHKHARFIKWRRLRERYCPPPTVNFESTDVWLLLWSAEVKPALCPLSNEHGTHMTVKARCWRRPLHTEPKMSRVERLEAKVEPL